MSEITSKNRGFVSGKTLLSLAGAFTLSLVWWVNLEDKSTTLEVTPLLETVKVDLFKLEITEPGEVESAENIEIKSEVRSRGSSSVNILKIVPEGTMVKKGDFLAKLDDASLQKDLLKQRISVHQANATLVKAEADVEAAKLALEEYLSGSYREKEEQLESAEFVAKENLQASRRVFGIQQETYGQRLCF